MEPLGSDIEGLSVYYCDLAGGATDVGFGLLASGSGMSRG